MLLGWGSDAFSQAQEQAALKELEKVCEPKTLEEMLRYKSATQLLNELLNDIKRNLE